jgi:hypothetical protein
VKIELCELRKRIPNGNDWKGVPMEQETSRIEILIVSHGKFLSTVVGAEGKLMIAGVDSPT